MRKMKKINGFLVVRFNDREKRNNPTLGSFGVIDAEQYTGDLDFDLDAFEYTDADLIEIAVEKCRGLDAEQDYSDEPPVYTVIVESAEEATEEEVEPRALSRPGRSGSQWKSGVGTSPTSTPGRRRMSSSATRPHSTTWA